MTDLCTLLGRHLSARGWIQSIKPITQDHTIALPMPEHWCVQACDLGFGGWGGGVRGADWCLDLRRRGHPSTQTAGWYDGDVIINCRVWRHRQLILSRAVSDYSGGGEGLPEKWIVRITNNLNSDISKKYFKIYKVRSLCSDLLGSKFPT